jgi:hypothetical protein
VWFILVFIHCVRLKSRKPRNHCTWILTYLWSWALPEKLPIVQPLKKFSAFYGTRRFITMFTRALHWSLSWARSIQSTTSHPIHFHILICVIPSWNFHVCMCRKKFKYICVSGQYVCLSIYPYVCLGKKSMHIPTEELALFWCSNINKFWKRIAVTLFRVAS